jgi:hypothetical protein
MKVSDQDRTQLQSSSDKSKANLETLRDFNIIKITPSNTFINTNKGNS